MTTRLTHGPKPTFGVIGTIGAGKSTVAARLKALGAVVIDADRLGHEALEDPDVKARLVSRWGERILANGVIDRRAVGRIVFADPAERTWLEGLTHPVIRQKATAKIAEAQATPGVTMVVLDAALLLEAGWGELVDGIVFVDAPWQTRVRRVAARSGWTEEELRRREASQSSAETKRQAATVCLMNDSTTDELERQVDRFHAEHGVAADRT